MMLYLRALFFWLLLFESITLLRGWHGFAWLPVWGRAAIPVGPLLLWPALQRRPAAVLAALALSAGPALALQLLLGLWRNRKLDPLDGLRPTDLRLVEAVQIPLATGYLPALYLRPNSNVSRAVAVVHGSGSGKALYSWRLAATLLTRGIAVLLFDIDGHGENPRPQSWPEITENAPAAVAWLRQRHRSVALIGVSLGGCLAAYAVATGTAVDALVVAESPPQLQFSRHQVIAEVCQLFRPRFWHVFADSSLYNFMRVWEAPYIRATIGTHDLIARLDLLASLAAIQAPLLLVYGGSDAIVPVAQAEAVRAVLPDHALFRVAPAASHLSLILDPQALMVIGDWLDQTLIPEE